MSNNVNDSWFWFRLKEAGGFEEGRGVLGSKHQVNDVEDDDHGGNNDADVDDDD